MKASIKDGKLLVEAKLNKPRPSKSGKTNVVVSTNGFIFVDGDDGKVYRLNINLITK